MPSVLLEKSQAAIESIASDWETSIDVQLSRINNFTSVASIHFECGAPIPAVQEEIRRRYTTPPPNDASAVSWTGVEFKVGRGGHGCVIEFTLKHNQPRSQESQVLTTA